MRIFLLAFISLQLSQFITLNCFDEGGFPSFPPGGTQPHQKISSRIRYSAETQAVWFERSVSPELGDNPSVSDKEVKDICQLSAVKFLAFYYGPVGNQELAKIMSRHKPTHIILRHARDETCALLSKHEQIENLEILGGDVSISGLLFLKRLPKLKSLCICTQHVNGISKDSLETFPGHIDVKVKCLRLTEL